MRYTSLSIFFLHLLTAQLAAAQGNAVANAVEKPFRVVIIGSSTAAGIGANPLDSAWVSRYEAYLKALNPDNQVINLAKGGYQTYNLLPTGFKIPPKRPYPDTLRNITRALTLQPDAIIVNLASNDAAAGYGVGEQMANFETIARTAKERDVPIWFSTTQPRDFSADKIAIQFSVRDSILRSFADRALNFWDSLATPDGHMDLRLNSGDGTHLNNLGHALLFERVRTKNILDVIAAQQKKHDTMNRVWAQTIPLSLHTFRPPPPKPKTGLPRPRQETVLLQASQPMEGVTVEIFSATGQLVRKQVYNLPVLIKTDFGPKGVYRVNMSKGSFNKVARLVKT